MMYPSTQRQLVNVADVMDPTLPDSPLPVLSVAFIDELQTVGSGFPARFPVLSGIPALTDRHGLPSADGDTRPGRPSAWRGLLAVRPPGWPPR
jgi:hypothetical protein